MHFKGGGARARRDKGERGRKKIPPRGWKKNFKSIGAMEKKKSRRAACGKARGEGGERERECEREGKRNESDIRFMFVAP